MNWRNVNDGAEGLAIGSLLSAGSASVWPETIHGAAVVATAIFSAIAVFFTNRYLRKRFPDGKL